MEQLYKKVLMAMMAIIMAVSFSACSDDDDAPANPNAYYDYSVIWSVVDKGDYSAQDAASLAAEFSQDDKLIYESYHEAEAIEDFDDYCQRFRYHFSQGYKTITLKATLTREEDNKAVKSHIFYITPDGTTIK